MKLRVIFVLLLFISMPISFAKELTISEIFEVEQTKELYSAKEVYFYIGGNQVAEFSGEIEYIHSNRIGNNFESKSLPFGEPIIVENRFSFTGKELDNKLYSFGARYYDPQLGRFNSVDPVPSEPSYQYVKNNPLGMTDHRGTQVNVIRESGNAASGIVTVGENSFRVVSNDAGRKGLFQVWRELQNIQSFDSRLLTDSARDLEYINFFSFSAREGKFNYFTGVATAHGIGDISHELAHAGEFSAFRRHNFLSEWHAYLREGNINILSKRPLSPLSSSAVGGDFAEFLRHYVAAGYDEVPSALTVTKMSKLNIVKSFLAKFGRVAGSEAFGLAGDAWGAARAFDDPESFREQAAQAEETAEEMGGFMGTMYRVGWGILHFFEIGAAANSPENRWAPENAYDPV